MVSLHEAVTRADNLSLEGNLMANGRHSYVRFFPSDWLGGTARLTRLHRSVFFDVCCYIWDTSKPCPQVELAVMIGDLKNGAAIVNDLVAMGKLERFDDGSVSNAKAMAEAEWAFEQWEKRSFGGRGGRNTLNSSDDNSDRKTHGTGLVSDNQNQNQNHISPNGDKRSRAKIAVKPDGVEQSTWDDFKALRTKKRAPLTETALKGIEREAATAGWSLEAALVECCERGWQGFKAVWVKGKEHGRHNERPSGPIEARRRARDK
ncbi:MAG: hypothetical protein ACRCYS_11450 [Beijerinckiaceae bacterium]